MEKVFDNITTIAKAVVAVVAIGFLMFLVQTCNGCISSCGGSMPSAPAPAQTSTQPQMYTVKITAYNLVAGQTDSTPCEAASGEICQRLKKERASGRWLCATSWYREANGTIVDFLPIGSQFMIAPQRDSKGHAIAGTGLFCTVADRTAEHSPTAMPTLDVACPAKDRGCVRQVSNAVANSKFLVRDARAKNVLLVPRAVIERIRAQIITAQAPAAKPTRATATPVPTSSTSETKRVVVAPLKITSPFGMRTDPFNGKRRNHQAVDVAGRTGDDVIAYGEGTVVSTGRKGGLGKTVTVTFAHLSAIDVQPGDSIAPGTVLGKVGSTGRSTASHLHVQMKDQNGEVVDPTPYVMGIGGE